MPTNIYFDQREHLGLPWAEHWVEFEAHMIRLGLVVHECEGPNGWGGPAVTIPASELSRVAGATAVLLDHHRVGDNIMVYPAPIEIGEDLDDLDDEDPG